jgi:hypothetical protein
MLAIQIRDPVLRTGQAQAQLRTEHDRHAEITCASANHTSPYIPS